MGVKTHIIKSSFTFIIIGLLMKCMYIKLYTKTEKEREVKEKKKI